MQHLDLRSDHSALVSSEAWKAISWANLTAPAVRKINMKDCGFPRPLRHFFVFPGAFRADLSKSFLLLDRSDLPPCSKKTARRVRLLNGTIQGIASRSKSLAQFSNPRFQKRRPPSRLDNSRFRSQMRTDALFYNGKPHFHSVRNRQPHSSLIQWPHLFLKSLQRHGNRAFSPDSRKTEKSLPASVQRRFPHSYWTQLCWIPGKLAES